MMTYLQRKIALIDRCSLMRNSRRYHVDMTAYLLALVLGPLMFTVITFWAFVPLAALWLGFPFFAICGGPLLYIYLRHFRGNGLVVTLMAAAMVFALGTLLGQSDQNLTRPLLTFDADLRTRWVLFFGPAWAIFFIETYDPLRSGVTRRPYYI